jgi:restriction system protein
MYRLEKFEHIVERLYASMVYKTALTPMTRDGGRDVDAQKDAPGQTELLLIEAKRYTRTIGVTYPRDLLGVVSDRKANKGVLVTNSFFSPAAEKFAADNPRLELINGAKLVPMLNEYLGPTWSVRIESIVNVSIREQVGRQAPERGSALSR